MHDKGYGHPLHCLDLLIDITDPDPRCLGSAYHVAHHIQVPEGILLTHAGLPKRASNYASSGIKRAVERATREVHQLSPKEQAALSERGLCAQWHSSLLYWCERMTGWEDRSSVLRRAQARWQAELQILRIRSKVEDMLPANEQVGPAQFEKVKGQLAELERDLREVVGPLQVVKGALLGEICYLSHEACAVFGQKRAAPFQVRALLGVRTASAKTSPDFAHPA